MSVDTNTRVYSMITIDPDTGAVLSSTPYGSSSGDNPLQMVSMISPDGVLYQGTEHGLIRVEAVPEPSTYALLAISAVALGAYVLRRRRLS